MPYMAHPNESRQIEVEIVDEESHHGTYHQVRAVDDGIELRDQSGNLPWVAESDLDSAAQSAEADEVDADDLSTVEDDGLHETPEDAVALAPGRTPEQAEAVREEREN